MQAVQDTLARPLVAVAHQRLLVDTRREILLVAHRSTLDSQLVKEEMVDDERQLIDGALQHVHVSRDEFVRLASRLPMAVDGYDLLSQRAAYKIRNQHLAQRWVELYAAVRGGIPGFYIQPTHG